MFLGKGLESCGSEVGRRLNCTFEFLPKAGTTYLKISGYATWQMWHPGIEKVWQWEIW